MDSLTVFLNLDSRKLYIVSTPMVDNDPVLLHKTKQISFSKFIKVIIATRINFDNLFDINVTAFRKNREINIIFEGFYNLIKFLLIFLTKN